MKNTTSRALLTFITVSLIVSIMASSGAISTVQATSGTTLTSSQPIRVDSDAELASLISTNDWNGSGAVDDPYIIQNLDIVTTGSNFAIYIGNTTAHLIIRNCSVCDAQTGPYDTPQGAGITLYQVKNATVENNTADRNNYGIYLYRSSDNIIRNNTCTGNVWFGIDLYSSCDNNTIEDNNCGGNSYGIILGDNCDNNTISNNRGSGNNNDLIFLSGSSRNIVTNNNCSGNSFAGIDLRSMSEHNIVENNTCGENSYGIYLDGSNYNSFRNNTCTGNSYGLRMGSSTGNTIENSTYSGSHNHGIYLDQSSGNNITGNNCSGNSDSGIYLDTSNGNRICDNFCTDTNHGIFMSSSSDNILSDNNCKGILFCGITLSSSDNNTISNGTFRGSAINGIFLSSSDHNDIMHNNCSGNGNEGIFLYDSSDNIIGDDDCSVNEIGIRLSSSSVNNTISNNSMTDNTDFGIYMETSSNDNQLFGNVLIGNKDATSSYNPSIVQAYDDGNNFWNTTAYGNYWGDWTTPDANHDGIVDLNYTISGGSGHDFLPLANVTFNITSPSSMTYTNSSSVTVIGNAADGRGIVSIVYYDAASGTSGTCTGTSPWSADIGLVEGPNVITITMTDTRGMQFHVSVTLIYDSISPTVSISAPASGSYNNTGDVTVTWTGNDVLSGLAYYEVGLDGAASITLTNSTLSHSFSGIADGTHTVKVTAVDGVGNSADATVTFTVDTERPNLTITTPIGGSYTNTGKVTWIGSDNTSGIAYYNVSIDGNAPITVSNDVSVFAFACFDGPHTVNVSAVDRAGNSANDTVTFTMETVGPMVTITTPASGSYNNTGNVTVTWTGSDETSGIASYGVSIDGGSAVVVSNSTLSQVFNGLTEGTHTVNVTAVDGAGNIAYDDVTFIVDTVRPVVTITSPISGSFKNTVNVTVTWTIGEATSGIATTEISTDGTTWTTVTGTSHLMTSLSDGAHTLFVKATDNAGNVNQSSVTFIVDTVDPTIVITSPQNGSYNKNGSVTVTWEGEDDSSGIATYGVCILGRPSLFLTQMTSYTFTDLNDGTYTVQISVSDRAGNSNSTTVTFTVDTVAPSLVITSPSTGSYHNTSNVTVTWEASDETSGVGNYFGVSIEGRISMFITNETSHTFNFSDGTYTIRIGIGDRAGNSNSTNVTITVDTTAPTITSASPTGDNVSLNATVVIGFSESMNASSVSIVVNGTNGAISWSGNDTTFAPSFALAYDTLYSVTVSGKDVAGNSVTRTWSFTTLKNEGTITGKITDASGLPIANATVKLSNGMTVTTDANGSFTFNNVTAGTFTMTVTKDGYQDMTENVNVTVGTTTSFDQIKVEASRSSSNDGLIIGLLAVLVIVLIGVGLFVYMRRKPKTP